jgi:Reverse transcriptase (RNA-dependent DNA polymerase)
VGLVEISDSAWAAPVYLIRKKDGTWKFCVDYRKLIAVMIRDIYPLPRIADLLSRLEGAQFVSILDLQAGYHQIPVRMEDRHKTAFIAEDGLFQFKVLPFGLSNGPSFPRDSMPCLLGRRHSILIDNRPPCVTTKTGIGVFRKTGLKLKVSKCRFAESSLKVLGHVVDADGIRPDPEKCKQALIMIYQWKSSPMPVATESGRCLHNEWTVRISKSVISKTFDNVVS